MHEQGGYQLEALKRENLVVVTGHDAAVVVSVPCTGLNYPGCLGRHCLGSYSSVLVIAHEMCRLWHQLVFLLVRGPNELATKVSCQVRVGMGRTQSA